MASKKKANRYANRLAQLAKTIAKTKPEKLHSPLFDVFVVVAATGDAKRAGRVLDWMYGRTPAPKEIANALSTQAIDGFCAAAKLGDRTNGLPSRGDVQASLSQRVKNAEIEIFARVTMDADGDEPPKDDAWQKRKEPWRTNDRWRRIQGLAAAKKETEALERLVGYLADLGDDARGAGVGDELALGLDLALRNKGEKHVQGWIARHGHWFESESFVLETVLCLPAVARAVARGLLKESIGLSESDLDKALNALDGAIETALQATTAGAGRVPRIQKRRVGAEYSQVHLQPAELNASEKKHVHFQKKTDSSQGMSLFTTMVGIATPSDTDYVDAEITIASSTRGVPDLKNVVQAVEFPLIVRGPLLLRSVTGDEDDAFEIPPGTYEVLARFQRKTAPRASADAGLRVFTLALSFHPTKSLVAPKTLRLESKA